MKPSQSVPESWPAFWDRDARHVQNSLNKELLGLAPLTVLLYQPVRERLVYLKPVSGSDEEIAKQPILGFAPTRSILSFLWSKKPALPWLSQAEATTVEDISDYFPLSEQDRLLILAAEKERY